MSLFCLVHGSTQSPAGWKLLASELGLRGHQCVCVDLPTNEPDASADRYADVIADTVRGMDAPIVVAHSAGGLVSTFGPGVHQCRLGQTSRSLTFRLVKIGPQSSVVGERRASGCE